MIRIAHEAPLKLIPFVKELTDYDYVLAHYCLGKQGEEYKEAMLRNRMGRTMIMDNSAFELGRSIEPLEYYRLYKELKPDELILPDVRGNKEETLRQSAFFSKCLSKEEREETTLIGVVQGATMEELLDCAIALLDEIKVDKIAVPYACKAYELLRHQRLTELMQVSGRIEVVEAITKIFQDRGLRPRFHLLGSSIPMEYVLYNPFHRQWIESTDTSAPVVSGLEGKRWFRFYGTIYKPVIHSNFFTKADFTDEILATITHNINVFKSIVNQI